MVAELQHYISANFHLIIPVAIQKNILGSTICQMTWRHSTGAPEGKYGRCAVWDTGCHWTAQTPLLNWPVETQNSWNLVQNEDIRHLLKPTNKQPPKHKPKQSNQKLPKAKKPNKQPFLLCLLPQFLMVILICYLIIVSK